MFINKLINSMRKLFAYYEFYKILIWINKHTKEKVSEKNVKGII